MDETDSDVCVRIDNLSIKRNGDNTQRSITAITSIIGIPPFNLLNTILSFSAKCDHASQNLDKKDGRPPECERPHYITSRLLYHDKRSLRRYYRQYKLMHTSPCNFVITCPGGGTRYLFISSPAPDNNRSVCFESKAVIPC